MASSGFNKEEFFEESIKIQAILKKDEFYSNPSVADEKAVRNFFAKAKKHALQSKEKSNNSMFWDEIIVKWISLEQHLTFLGETRKMGMEKERHESNKFITVYSFNGVMKLLLLNPSERRQKINDFPTSRTDSFNIIFDAIHEKIPNTKTWLKWHLDTEWIAGKPAFINGNLISTRAISDKSEAEKWCKRLNSINGFESAVSIEERGSKSARGWILVISSHHELVERLEQIKNDKEKDAKFTGSSSSITSSLASTPPAKVNSSPANKASADQKRSVNPAAKPTPVNSGPTNKSADPGDVLADDFLEGFTLTLRKKKPKPAAEKKQTSSAGQPPPKLAPTQKPADTGDKSPEGSLESSKPRKK